MSRLTRFGPVVAAAALLAAALGPVATASASASACGGSGSTTTINGSLPDQATYEIQCPAGHWNGTLFLYSHGYVVPGSVTDELTGLLPLLKG